LFLRRRGAGFLQCAVDVTDARRKSEKDADQKQLGLRVEQRIEPQSEQGADDEPGKEFRSEAHGASDLNAPCATRFALVSMIAARGVQTIGELIERRGILLGAV